MTLLLSPAAWSARARSLTGDIGTLADGMARDLEPVLARPVYAPAEKALLSREGGRCPRDGSLLEFEPFEEHRHRCATCGGVFEGEAHRGFWRYWYHLWLAERAVHAAVLHRLRGDARHAALAAGILDGYAMRYLAYPNQDNVLGPTRPFFSTYLESIWLLQLCIALDTLEGHDAEAHVALGARVRERLVEPSLQLVASYDEGMSNRQVWNVAAQLAALRVLGRDHDAERVVAAPHGLSFLLERGLLQDGTWYEGENYHMFAHRGLWYGVTMAAAAGWALPHRLVARFDAGFLAPFLTALPDMTLPSRRDSQYAISLRQPRFAEPCELGLARRDDTRLAGVLAALYEDDAALPVRSNGRSRTSADVERNLPPMRLARSDLSWRALLFARSELPQARPSLPGSTLLEGQGIAVMRRDRGRVYAALDYGHSGGGHGHPDRLNLLLADGATRLLDDMGTGSYVERTLHWYRSTLAHNAPLVDGHSQPRVDGELLAWEDRGGAGWVRARVRGLAPGVEAVRTVVVMPDYLLEELRWESGAEVTLDLPLHAPLQPEDGPTWEPAAITGGGDLEDGFDFVSGSRRHAVPAGEMIHFAPGSEPFARATAATRATVACDQPAEWWRLEAPGAPGTGSHTFHLVRVHARRGRVRSVWTWSRDAAADVTFAEERTIVRHAGDLADTHFETPGGWRVDLQAGAARSSIDLGGLRAPVGIPARDAARTVNSSQAVDASADERMPTLAAQDFANALRTSDAGAPIADLDARTPTADPHANSTPQDTRTALDFHLAEPDYRRSEATWDEAGRPVAHAEFRWDGARLRVAVDVTKADALVLVPDGAENPLDNEAPEINGDGVQLYVVSEAGSGGWTIVPAAESAQPRAVAVRGWTGVSLGRTTWEPTPRGYRVTAEIDPGATWAVATVVRVGLIVNETAPGRARRRGQLVLGGAAGEWVYLRGDRHDPDRLLPIRLLPRELS